MAGSTGVHDTVVNQLLSKIDGVEQLNNILVIGMFALKKQKFYDFKNMRLTGSELRSE